MTSEIPQRRIVGLIGGLALAAVSLLALSWGSVPLGHDDLFWHLQAGDGILDDREIPDRDRLSFTKAGTPWITHEWLFSAACAVLYRLGGFEALRLGQALAVWLLLAAIGLAAGAAVRATPIAPDRRGPPAVLLAGLAPLLGLTLWTVREQLFLRAALFGSVFFALLIWLLESYRRSGRRGWLLGVLALLLVWTNLHSGVIFGVACLGCYAAAAVGAPIWRRVAGAGEPLVESRRGSKDLLICLAAAFPVLLINPNGIEGPLYPFRLADTLMWSGLDYDLGHFNAGSPIGHLPLALLLSTLVAGRLPSLKRPLPSAGLLLTTALMLALSFRSPRFQVELCAVLVPAVAVTWLAGSRAVAPTRQPSPGRWRWVAPTAALVTTAVALGALVPHRQALARDGGPLASWIPVDAAGFLLANDVRGRMFNHQNHGGYLGWRLREPMFWDGRSLVFRDLVREVATQPFDELLDRYSVDHMLITPYEYRRLEPLLAAGEWAPVYWDARTAIYLRRTDRLASLIERTEYRVVPPFGNRFDVRPALSDPAWAAAARRELDRALGSSRGNQRALYFSALLRTAEGDLLRARDELAQARALGGSYEVWTASALLAEQLGHVDEAARLRREAEAWAPPADGQAPPGSRTE